MSNLTLEEQATNFETMKHIEKVRNYINIFIKKLLDRAEKHDQTKLTEPEVQLFTKYTNCLAKTTYGSEEYEEYLKKLKPALNHHYANNSHHPEYYPDGIDGMNLLDIVELYCDWISAVSRHENGNLRHSIEHNKKRFHMSDQLTNIFLNTMSVFDK